MTAVEIQIGAAVVGSLKRSSADALPFKRPVLLRWRRTTVLASSAVALLRLQSQSLSALRTISLLLILITLVSEASPAFGFQMPPTTHVLKIGIANSINDRIAARRTSPSSFRHPLTTSSHPLSKSAASSSRRKSGRSSKVSESTLTAFNNKSILLTGASRGLGKSLARALSACHPSLLILSGRDEPALRGVQAECLEIAAKGDQSGESSTKVEIVVCDLGDNYSVEKLATTSLQLARQHSPSGVVDVLINNGGISSRSSFMDTKSDVDERLMQVNFLSGAALAKRLVPGMARREDRGGGRLIWISSVQGKLGTPYRTSYAASKFAVQGYCEALRSELATSNVSVHVVSPGYIRTNLSMSAMMGDGSSHGKMDETTANGADPDEAAANILSSIAAGKTDFVVAATFSAKAAMWLKFLAPSFLESRLVKRFEKYGGETSS